MIVLERSTLHLIMLVSNEIFTNDEDLNINQLQRDLVLIHDGIA